MSEIDMNRSISPVPSMDSEFSDFGSKLDLDQIPGLLNSYIITPHESGNDGEDEVQLFANEHDNFDDLEINDEGREDEAFQDRHLKTIAEEPSEIENFTHSFAELPIDERSMAEMDEFLDSREFHQISNNDALMNKEEREFSAANILIQDDQRFLGNPRHFPKKHSWEPNTPESPFPGVKRTQIEESKLTPNLKSTEMDFSRQESYSPMISTPNSIASFVSGEKRSSNLTSRLNRNFGSISAVSHSVSPPNKKSLQNEDISLVNRISHLDLSENSILTSSAIQRCLNNVTLGAEKTALAQAILKASETLGRAKNNNKNEHEHENKWEDLAENGIKSGVVCEKLLETEAFDENHKKSTLLVENDKKFTCQKSDQSIETHQETSHLEEIASENSTKCTVPLKDIANVDSNCRRSKRPISDVGVLESSQSRLNFGFVDLNDCALQSLQLHNNSDRSIRLLPDSESMLIISAGEKLAIRVRFRPTLVANYNNALRMNTVDSSLRYTITLHGHGGCAHVTLDKSDHVTMSRNGDFCLVHASRVSNFPLKLINHGYRDAFVRLVVAMTTPLTIKPTDSVVVKHGNTRELHVEYPDSLDTDIKNSASSPIKVILFWGEETQRQKLRRYETRRNKQFLIEGRSFTNRFCGEENVKALPPDIPIDISDYKVFMASLRRTVIKIFTARQSLVKISTDQSKSDDSIAFGDGKFAALIPDISTMVFDLGKTVVFDSTIAENDLKIGSKPEKRSRKRQTSPETNPTTSTQKLNNFFEPSKIENTVWGESKVIIKERNLNFVSTRLGGWDSVKIELRNLSKTYPDTLKIETNGPPFSVRIYDYSIDPSKYVRIPVYFTPKTVGDFHGILYVTPNSGQKHEIFLQGKAIP